MISIACMSEPCVTDANFVWSHILNVKMTAFYKEINKEKTYWLKRIISRLLQLLMNIYKEISNMKRIYFFQWEKQFWYKNVCEWRFNQGTWVTERTCVDSRHNYMNYISVKHKTTFFSLRCFTIVMREDLTAAWFLDKEHSKWDVLFADALLILKVEDSVISNPTCHLLFTYQWKCLVYRALFADSTIWYVELLNWDSLDWTTGGSKKL